MDSSTNLPAEGGPQGPFPCVDELQELREAYDFAPFGMCTLDVERRIVRINRMALGWLGVPRETLKTVQDLLPFLSAKSRQAYDVATFLFDKSRRVEGLDLELTPPGMPVRTVRLTALSSFYDTGALKSIRASFFDITELCQLQANLQRLNQEQAAMLNSDLVGILKVEDRRIVWQNKTFLDLLGYSAQELSGQSTDIFWKDHDAHHRVGPEAYKTIDKTGTYRTQLRLRHKSGRYFWADLTASRLPDTNQYVWVCLDITIQKEQQQQVEHLAFHDALTGLPNRLLMSDRLAQACRAADRKETCVAVCYIDLDGFKPVNDIYGHEAGDRLLRQLAERFRQATRSIDTVARLGGDEFVLVAPVDKLESFNAMASRMLKAAGEPVKLSAGRSVSVSLSIGVAMYPLHGRDELTLLAAADKALYEAKKAGKNQVVLAQPGLAPDKP